MAKTTTQRLRLVRLKLRNWRNFNRVDIHLSDRVFLVGPNASGKSNLLDALRFLGDLVWDGGGFQSAIRSRGGVSALRWLGAKRYPEVEIEIHLRPEHGQHDDAVIAEANWVYSIGFTQDNNRRPVISSEKVTTPDGKVMLNRPDSEDGHDQERLSQSAIQQLNVNKEFRVIWDYLRSVRFLHLVPQLIREPERYVLLEADDPYGGDFLERLAKTQKRTRDSRLRKIGEILRVAVPQLQELSLDSEIGKPHLKGRYVHWRPQGAWQQEADFSDGTLRLIGLLWALFEGTGPVLLEEPELSLHPEVVKRLPQLFAKIAGKTGRQMFCSTHSSDLLADQGIGLDEVFLLTPSEEGTEVAPASSKLEIRALLEARIPMGEAVLPFAAPKNVQQLTFFQA